MEIKENEDYIILPDPVDPEGCVIKVLKGQYIGVIFLFDNIRIREVDDGANIDFKYIVVTTPSPSPILDKDHFSEFTMAVLHDIMINSEDDAIKLTDANGNELTDYDIKKPSAG